MTKLTNEELRKLLRQYAAAMYAYTVSEYDSDDEKQSNAKADEIKAEILQRMAEGAAGEASPQGDKWVSLIGPAAEERCWERMCKSFHDEIADALGLPREPMAGFHPMVDAIKRLVAESASASTAGPRPYVENILREFVANYARLNGMREQLATPKYDRYVEGASDFADELERFFAAAPAEDTPNWNIEAVRKVVSEAVGSPQFYQTQEMAMAPGIADGWPEVIDAPHTKNGRLKKVATESLIAKFAVLPPSDSAAILALKGAKRLLWLLSDEVSHLGFEANKVMARINAVLANENSKPEDVQLDVEAARQQEIDISNLRFYSRMAAEHKWGTDIIHFGVIEQTLKEIADRLALLHRVSAPEIVFEFSPSPCGHSSQYAYTENGGKNIVCLVCEREAAPVPATPEVIPGLWRLDPCKRHKDYVDSCSACEEEVLTVKLEKAYRAGFKAGAMANSQMATGTSEGAK